jgi:transcriptional regulator with XRE-family HTH domain
MLGNRIQEILVKKGMTQIELADKIGMSVAHVNRIINNRSEPDKTIAKIAEALDVPIHALYSEDAQISALAVKSIENLPADVVQALGDQRKLNYVLLGLDLSEGELSPEEIKLLAEERERVNKKLKEIKKNK